MQPVSFPHFDVQPAPAVFPFPKTSQSLPTEATLTFGFSHVLYSSLLRDFFFTFSAPVQRGDSAYFVKLPDLREALFPLNAFALHISLRLALPQGVSYSTSASGIVDVFALTSEAAVASLEAADHTLFTAVLGLYSEGVTVSSLLVTLPAGIFSKPRPAPPKPAPAPAGKRRSGGHAPETRLSAGKIVSLATSRDGSFELQELARTCSEAEFDALLRKSLPLLSDLMQSGASGRG